jgi:tetratricopeptide (TPR) repeat protein
MQQRVGALAVALAVALALPATASARERSDSLVSPEAQAQAKLHFQRGMAAFELGNFQEALDEYERAYQIAPLPGFLFNIGQCHRNLGNLRKAVFSFRLYLRKRPDAKNREAVQTLIRELEAKIDAERAAAKLRVPVYVAPPDDGKRPPRRLPPPPIYKRWWFWTGIAAALGGGAVGIYFGTRTREAAVPDSYFPVLDLSRR